MNIINKLKNQLVNDDLSNHPDTCRCSLCMKGATANPIKSTIEKSKKYPQNVIIYQCKRSKWIWYTRIRVPLKQSDGKEVFGYKKKSTNQKNKQQAMVKADEFYDETMRSDLLQVNKSIQARTQFKNVALLCLEKEIKLNTPKGYVNYRGIMTNVLIPYFGRRQLKNIGYHEILSFYNDLKKTPCSFINVEGILITKNIKPPTKKHYRVCLRRILKFAMDSKIIRQLPNFPDWKEKNTISSRDYLTENEYAQFCKFLISVTVGKKKNVMWRTYPIMKDFHILVRFMVNSFLRPSDLKVLKHKHIEIKSDGRGKGKDQEPDRWLRLTHPATKTTDTPIISMQKAVELYEELIEFRKANPINGRVYLDEDDYLFEPKYDKGENELDESGKAYIDDRRNQTRKYAMAIMSNQFRMAINASGIKERTGKDNITLYSLRHSSIMFRLIKGNVQLIEIARNARTSPNMIDKFYGSHLLPDHVRKAIHSFKDTNDKKAHAKLNEVVKGALEEHKVDQGSNESKSNIQLKLEIEKLQMQLEISKRTIDEQVKLRVNQELEKKGKK